MPRQVINTDGSLDDILEILKENNPDFQNIDPDKKQFLTTPEFAQLVGFHEQTLRYWDKIGRFKPHHRTPGGTRMYAVEQIKDLMEMDLLAGDSLTRNCQKIGAKLNQEEQDSGLSE